MFKKVLEYIALFIFILGAIFCAAKVLYQEIPQVRIDAYEKKVEEIRPTQSYAYICSVLGEAMFGEKYSFPLQDGGSAEGTRRIWANDAFVLIGYFKDDASLYGYLLISRSEKFNPKNDFCELQKTDFAAAHKESGCYIDTASGHFCENVLCTSYYMELYDFGRSDFLYGLAITNLGVGFDAEQLDGVNKLPYYQIIMTPEAENPATNQEYAQYRSLYPNAMLLFDNRSDIDYIAFFKEITNGKFGITYSDLRRGY